MSKDRKRKHEREEEQSEARAEDPKPMGPAACVCGRPDFLEIMVACDSIPHPGVEDGNRELWLHYSCAGLTEAPSNG